MSALRLTLTSRPPARVDLSPLTAQPLAGRSAAEIAAISLVVGNRRVRLDELFRITGTPGEALEIAGGDDRLDRIGAGLAGGRIVVEGDAGAYLGQRMTGGSITVSGHAGAFAAEFVEGAGNERRIVSGRGGIPERERGDPVGVDMLRTLLEFGKPRQRIPCFFIARVIDFEKDRLVTLCDHRVFGVVAHVHQVYTVGRMVSSGDLTGIYSASVERQTVRGLRSFTQCGTGCRHRQRDVFRTHPIQHSRQGTAHLS